MVNKSDYVTILGWMTQLGIKGNELITYAIIYGYSKNKQGCFYGSEAYLAEWTGTSDRAIRDILRSLENKKLVKKTTRKGFTDMYEAIEPRKKLPDTPEETSALPRKKLPDTPEETSDDINIYITKRDNTINKEESSESLTLSSDNDLPSKTLLPKNICSAQNALVDKTVDKEFYDRLKQAIDSQNLGDDGKPHYANYAIEGKKLKELVKMITDFSTSETRNEFAKKFLETFKRMKNENKFWKTKPFTARELSSSFTFSAVVEEMKSHKSLEDGIEEVMRWSTVK